MNVIVAAAVGALAAILGNTIPSMLRIWAERRAAGDQRAEQRLLQLAALKQRLLEADAMAVSDAIDAVVTNLRDIAQFAEVQQALRKLQAEGKATSDEVRRQEDGLQRDLAPRSAGLNHALVRGSRRAFSLGDGIWKMFMKVDGLAGRLHRAMLGKAAEDQPALWLAITESGGALQAELRGYLLRSAGEALGVGETILESGGSPPNKRLELTGAAK